MTIYYLRKLFQEKQAQLIWNYQDLGYPVDSNDFLEKVRNGQINASISLETLERLVTFHQALIEIYEEDSQQVLDIEFQLYKILGIQQKILSGIEPKSIEVSEKLSPKRCLHLLHKIKRIRARCDALIGPKITSYYLSTLIRKKQEQLGSTSLKPFEILALDSIFLNIDTGEIDELFSQQIREKEKGESNQEILLRQTEQSHNVNKAASSPQRIRELLKQFNALQTHWQSLIGESSALICLIKSRPDHDWCLLFNISKVGSTYYSGNLQELITNSRLKVYNVWTQQFISNCESYHSQN